MRRVTGAVVDLLSCTAVLAVRCHPVLATLQALRHRTMAAWLRATRSAASTMPPPQRCLWPAAACHSPLAFAAPASASTPPAPPPWWACTWRPGGCRLARRSSPTPLVSPPACYTAPIVCPPLPGMHAYPCLPSSPASQPALFCRNSSPPNHSQHFPLNCRLSHPDNACLHVVCLDRQHAVVLWPLPRSGCLGRWLRARRDSHLCCADHR